MVSLICYYLIDSNAIKRYKNDIPTDFTIINDNYLWFGFTASKKLAKAYEKIHQMNKFYKKKVDLTEDEYETIQHSYGEFMIQERNLLYQENKEAIKLAMTDWEHMYCTSYLRECMEMAIEKIITIDWRIFTKDIQNTLKSIKYAYEFDTIYHESFPHHPLFPDMEYAYNYKDLSTIYINRYGYRNELFYFIYYYGDVLRNDILEVLL